MRELLVKLGSIIFSTVLFYSFFQALHELGHWQFAQWVGVPGGNIIITWIGGYYYYPPDFIPSPWQDLWVSLGGGFTVAGLFFIGWLIRHWSAHYSPWDLDDSFALMAAGASQFLYAFSEIINAQDWGSGIALIVGFALATLVYGKRLWHWFYGGPD